MISFISTLLITLLAILQILLDTQILDLIREDQYQLADVFKKLDKRGCRILLSNSNTPIIRKLYQGYPSVEVQVNRAINSKASKRTGHTELLIRNYN